MTPFSRNVALFSLVVLLLFAGGIWVAARQMPRMLADSRAELQIFLRALEREDFKAAHTQFSPSLKADLTEEKLRASWRKTRTKIGQLKGFETADLTSPSGGRVNVWPPFVDYILRARGDRGNQVWSFRLKPENDGWKIERLTELRQSDAQRPLNQ